ncbi:muconolactone Delta-isomerase [Nocardia carnea]|uniref:muconolactone Delta-isomerase n=1 Tax=Nocardia carnea TaxID=37328 RepID=UPI002458A9D0|nr:muconolactone Delta-isomerase family protein [Nocardia carnea]
MAEFLVHISVRRPASVDDDSWRAILADEARVGTNYRRSGVIARIWRLPGTTSNVGLWIVSDATELHTLLSELPAFPYMTIRVDALAQHYLEESTSEAIS